MNLWIRSSFFLNQSYATWLLNKQDLVFPNERDYSYLEFIQRGLQFETNQQIKSQYVHLLRSGEAKKEIWSQSIKEISPLIQFDPEPNRELKEVKVELYKISVSFSHEIGGTFTI